MAGRIERGFESPEEPDMANFEKYLDLPEMIHISEGVFDAEVLPMHYLPGIPLMEAMLIPAGPEKFLIMTKLFMSALNSERDVATANLLTFKEWGQVIETWFEQSGPGTEDETDSEPGAGTGARDKDTE